MNSASGTTALASALPAQSVAANVNVGTMRATILDWIAKKVPTSKQSENGNGRDS